MIKSAQGRRNFLALAAALSMTLGASGVQAHHSGAAEFNLNKRMTIQGVITRVEWINPHSQMELAVKDKAGQVQNWEILTVGVAAMRKTGAGNKDLFKIGDTYKMQVYPARVGANRALLETVTFPDGRTMSLSLN